MEDAQTTDNLFNNTAADIAQFRRISIPLMRRVYPSLMANNLISVQPLNGPASLIYYLDYRFAVAGETTNANPYVSSKVDWKREGF
jgi:hypothetical protein